MPDEEGAVWNTMIEIDDAGSPVYKTFFGFEADSTPGVKEQPDFENAYEY